MPVHDWARADANVFHHFHQAWTVAICAQLNAGLLPSGYSALVEQHTGGLVPDVLALERRFGPSRRRNGSPARAFGGSIKNSAMPSSTEPAPAPPPEAWPRPDVRPKRSVVSDLSRVNCVCDRRRASRLSGSITVESCVGDFER